VGDDRVRHAPLADGQGQGAGVDPGQGDHAAALQPAVQVGVGAGGGGRALAELLDVLDVDPDIADVREGEGDDLGHVGGVGEDLLIAAHGGVETDLADRLADRADPIALQDGPVGQGQDAGGPGHELIGHGWSLLGVGMDGHCRKTAGRSRPRPPHKRRRI
jgi:hypothetical protein